LYQKRRSSAFPKLADCSHGVCLHVDRERFECVTERFPVVVFPEELFEILSGGAHRCRSLAVVQKAAVERDSLSVTFPTDERVAAIEAELGIDAQASQQTVADD
jgi:hypothetical protein